MFSGFDSAWKRWNEELGKYIDARERSFLENRAPGEFDLADILDEYSFVSIQGLTGFWDAQPGIDFAQHITDLVTAAHNQLQEPLVVVLAGTPQKLSVYVSLGNPRMTKAILEGIIPGIRLEGVIPGVRPDPAVVKNLSRRLGPHFQYKGILSGIPSRKTASASSGGKGREEQKGPESPSASLDSLSQLERIVRGMHEGTWAYIVHAHPRPREAVVKSRLEVIDQLADIISTSRFQRQATNQESSQRNPVISGGNTETLSGEMISYRAQYLIRLLERELERLDQAMGTGQWSVKSYFGARTQEDVQRLASLLVGTLAGKDSRPDALRVSFCRGGGAYLADFDTFLSSDEVATLIQFPREEVPGLAIHDYVRFDVDFRPIASANLELGLIQQHGKDTHDAYAISLDDLAKHGVVVGVTGSGKTTTVMNLLDRVVDAGKSFLVIEPAKREYRALRNALAGRTDLRIYTLGNENVAPFRLNPFEFETTDEPGSASVVNHIDFLKAVFNAAFILYAPMPYVLEMALHEIYEDKGWDLASGQNIRLPESEWPKRHLYPIFPTLTDLYRKVEVVTDRLGYDGRVEQDVKAGLKARIGSMRIGSKGLMLDTARGISMQQLLSVPTLLELEDIGGDDEKTFLMGLLLAKLYEYRRLQAASGMRLSGLQHVIIFEEAHRLLKNTDTQVSTESSNLRGQAIEVFTNMLSEVRAYGQGVLVAEQIPAKLAPDVLKNTNLKIAHRIVAQDDRESVGQTMNLNREQMTHLGILPAGTAAIYAEGADHAYLVRLENYKRKLAPLSDTKLKGESPKYASVKPYLSVLEMERYPVPRSAFDGPDPMIYQDAGRLLDTPSGRRLWANLLIRTVFSRPQLPSMLKLLRQLIVHEMPSLPAQRREATLRMSIVRGCFEALHERGAASGLLYTRVEEMRLSLTQGLLTLLKTDDLSLASSDLDRFARKYEQHLEREHGPFTGCVHCSAKCLYRFDVRNLLSRVEKEWIDDDMQKNAYAAMAKTVKGIAKRWLGESNSAVPGLGYCGALHVASSLQLTEYEQGIFADRLAKELP